MSDYQPIPCASHERLEFSVLRRTPLLLEYEGGEGRVQEQVLPRDVATRGGAEWLRFQREDGSEREIRLDCILTFREVSS